MIDDAFSHDDDTLMWIDYTAFDERLKRAKLATNKDLDTFEQRAIENKGSIKRLIIFDLSYFLGKSFFNDDGFQNMFLYRPIFDTLKEGKDIEYNTVWKSKRLFKSRFHPLYNLV